MQHRQPAGARTGKGPAGAPCVPAAAAAAALWSWSCRRGGDRGAGAQVLPLVLRLYGGLGARGRGWRSGRQQVEEPLARGGHEGNGAALLAICCTVPLCQMTVPGNRGLGYPANAPSSFSFFSFEIRQMGQATSYSLDGGAVGAPVVALARQVTSHAALVPLGSCQSHVRLSPAPVFGVALR